MAEAYPIVITFLLVVVFATFEGITHAILWSRKGVNAFKWNEHYVFVVTRILFGIATVLPGSMAGLICGVLAYPFFHNGFYYQIRNRIDKSYPKGFFSESTTSTATINFGVRFRTILFIGSILLLIFALIKP